MSTQNLTFALPGNGQSKPIESFWRMLDKHLAKRFEGRGTLDNPVPVAEMEAAVQEVVSDWNRSLTQ